MSSSSAPAAVQYSITFVNDTPNTWTACVYQTDPNVNLPDVQSLAWFAGTAAPGTSLQFPWMIDYGFVWSESEPLEPGVVFNASEHWPANLTTANLVTFTQPQSDAGPYFTFANQMAGPHHGSLQIVSDSTISLGKAAVGIAMSGAGVFAVPAQPNINLIFTPHPSYWITAGQFEPGQVLDLPAITNSAKIDFPPGVYAMTAILNSDNTWTVRPS